MESALSGSVLLSGLVSAVVSAAISLVAALYVDKRNKDWTLRAELRRYDVSSLIAATTGLRVAFFDAVTQMEYHSLELGDIESEYKMAKENARMLCTHGAGVEGQSLYLRAEAILSTRKAEAYIRYNSKVSAIEAHAKALVGSLEYSAVHKELSGQLEALLKELTGSTAGDAESVNSRIAFFYSKYPILTSLLTELNRITREQISESIAS